MMIDYTFFQDGLLRVDGAMALATPSPTNEALTGFISSFISKYEPEYLRKLLGDELYNDFLVHENEGDHGACWEELKSLLVSDYGEFKTSPIANYVYFHLLRNTHSTATLNGVKADGETNLISPQRKMVYAWNDMVDSNRRIYVWAARRFKNIRIDQEMLEPINEFNI